MKPISAKLKQIRESFRLSQAEMAEKLKVSQSTYSGYESGKSEPRYSEIINLITVLKVPSADLFDLGVGMASSENIFRESPAVYVVPGNHDVPRVLPEHISEGYKIVREALDAARVDISTMDQDKVGLVIGLAAEEVAKGNQEETRRTLLRRAEVLLGLRVP